MTKITRLCGALPLIFLLAGGPAACTETGPGTPGADAGALPDTSHASDSSIDELTVESIAPAHGATGVSVWTAVDLRLSASTDPGSLDSAQIDLTYAGGVRRAVQVTPSGDSLIVAPTDPLGYGVRYTLGVAGVVSVDGAPLSPVETSFTTFVNPKTRSDRREGGNVTAWTKYEIDAEGRTLRRTFYDGRGDDGQWFTGDDRAKNYTVYAYEPAAPVAGSATYDGPGEDQLWFTGDDQLASLKRTKHDADGLPLEVINYASAGADGIIFTSDDVVRDYQAWSRSADLATTISSSDPGPDGLWRTSDDVPSSYEIREYDATRRLTSHVRYDGPGDDGRWQTGDDRPAFEYSYVYFDNKLRTIHRAGATSRVQWYSHKEFLANGETVAQYDGPGEDEVWFTGDDHRAYHDRIERQDGRVVQATRFGESGPIERILVYEYESHGSMTRGVEYDGPGYDEAWGTSDDRVAHYFAIAYDARGNRTSYNRYDGPGADKIWFTADDQLSSESVHDPSL